MNRFVLITRHPAECDGMQKQLDPCGITLRPYPVIRLEDVDDEPGWQTLLDHIRSGDRPTWIVMASPRAPERFADQARRREAEALFSLPVAVIGEATAAAALEAGFDTTLIGPGTGLGLAEELSHQLTTPATLIFAGGHHRRPELPDALVEDGHEVLPVVVYRMRPTPPRELPPLGPSLEAVVVTSPRAARLYLEGVGGQPLPCPHWALGPTTRDAARALGIECLIPPEPNLRSLAEELCRI